MFYQLLRFLAKIAASIFYRKIHFWGKENLKSDRPTLIACNHPSGFAEPIILGCLLDLPLHFLVRGDMFNNKWLVWLLEHTNQIPIFRFKDGFKGLRNNQKHLNALKNKLIAGERIVIFVEGSTEMNHQLRSLQKGISRMAQDALTARPDLEIDILPVGINFTDSPKFRSDVMLSIGEPITLDKSFIEGDAKLNIREFTKDLYGHMKKHIIHIDDLKDEPELKRKLLPVEIKHFENVPPIWQENRNQLTESIAIANAINEGQNSKQEEPLEFSFMHQMYYFFGFLLAIPGFLIYIIPAIMIKLFLGKTVKKTVFYSSIAIACILVTMLVYHIVMIILLAVIGKLYCIVWIIPSGLFTLWYYDIVNLKKKIKLNNEFINVS